MLFFSAHCEADSHQKKTILRSVSLWEPLEPFQPNPWTNSYKQLHESTHWKDSTQINYPPPSPPDASFARQGARSVFDWALSLYSMASDEPKAKRIKLEEKKLRYSKHKHRLSALEKHSQKKCVEGLVKHRAVCLRALFGQRSMCCQLSVFPQKRIVVALGRNVSGIFPLTLTNVNECS